METEYGSYLGLSAKRANWLENWLREMCSKGSVSGRNMAQGPGCLGFAALALEWEKPFLGPLYSWLTEELASKNSQLELSWLRRDHNQLADDLTNEKFDMFDSALRIPLKGRNWSGRCWTSSFDTPIVSTRR